MKSIEEYAEKFSVDFEHRHAIAFGLVDAALTLRMFGKASDATVLAQIEKISKAMDLVEQEFAATT